MKRWIALALALLLALSLMACGGKTGGGPEASNAPDAPAPTAETGTKATEAPAQTTAPTKAPEATATPAPTAEPTPEPTAAVPDANDVDVEVGKKTVTITLPQSLVGDIEDPEEYAEDNMEEGITDIQVNEDGSVTYTMTKEKHEEMMKELTEQLDEALTSMVGSEDSPSITKTEHSPDFSSITLFVDQDKSDGMESFNALALTMAGAMYRAYAGETDVNCNVRLMDAGTKEEISTVNYQDWLDFMEMFTSGFDDWEFEEPDPVIPLPDMDPVVVYDADGITATVEGLGSEHGSTYMSLTVVNDSDKDIQVDCAELYINGYQSYGGIYDTVAAGDTLEENMYLSVEELTDAGVTAIGKIEIRLSVVDPDTWETLAEGDLVEIVTSDYGPACEVKPQGALVYSDDDVTILFLGVKQVEMWDDEYSWKYIFYFENNSDKRLYINCESLALNGIEAESWLGMTVDAGRRGVNAQSFSSEELAEMEIETVDEVTVSFSAMDDDTWEDLFKTDEITLPVVILEG